MSDQVIVGTRGCTVLLLLELARTIERDRRREIGTRLRLPWLPVPTPLRCSSSTALLRETGAS